MAKQKSKSSKNILGLQKKHFIILCIVGVVILTPFAYHFIKSIMAVFAVTNARIPAEKQADELLAARVTFLKNAGIIQTNIASSKIDVCRVDHDDQGWFAASWRQDCYLRYVEGYTTTLDRKTVMEKLKAIPATTALFGDPGILECQLYELDYKSTLSYRLANSSISKDYHCGIQNQLGEDKEYMEYSGGLATKEYKTYDAKTVDNTKDQVWVFVDKPYYHEELGCGVGFIFCENPRPHPSM